MYSRRSTPWMSAWVRTLPQRLRKRGWGLLLVPLAMRYAVMAGRPGLIPARGGARGPDHRSLRPQLATKAGPFGVLGLAVFGVMLVQDVPATANPDHQTCLPRGLGPGPDRLRTGAGRGARSCSQSALGSFCGWTRPAPGTSGRWRPVAAAAAAGSPPSTGAAPDPGRGAGLEAARAGDWFGFQAVDGPRRGPVDLTAGHGRGRDLPGPPRARVAATWARRACWSSASTADHRGVSGGRRFPGSRTSACPTCHVRRPAVERRPAKARSCWPRACS